MAPPTAAAVSDSDLLLLAGVAQSVGAAPADLLAMLYADSGLQTNAGAARLPRPAALGIGLVTEAEAMERLGMNEAAWLDIPNQSFVLQLGQVKRLLDGPAVVAGDGYPNAVALYQYRIAQLAVGPSILFRAPSGDYVSNAFLDTGKKGFVESEDLRQFLIARTTGTGFVDYMKRLQVVSGTPGAMPRIPVDRIVSSNDATLATATEKAEANSIPWGSIALAGAVGLGAFFVYKQLRPSPKTPTLGASSGSDSDEDEDEDEDDE